MKKIYLQIIMLISMVMSTGLTSCDITDDDLGSDFTSGVNSEKKYDGYLTNDPNYDWWCYMTVYDRVVSSSTFSCGIELTGQSYGYKYIVTESRQYLRNTIRDMGNETIHYASDSQIQIPLKRHVQYLYILPYSKDQTKYGSVKEIEIPSL